jgi:hypothetical protein
VTNRTRVALFLAMMIPATIACCQSYEITETGSDAGAEECAEECAPGRTCCGDVCVDTRIDPFNCGKCGYQCPDEMPVCAGGCVPKSSCGASCNSGEQFCCGNQCCNNGEVCCYDFAGHFECVGSSAGSCSL